MPSAMSGDHMAMALKKKKKVASGEWRLAMVTGNGIGDGTRDGIRDGIRHGIRDGIPHMTLFWESYGNLVYGNNCVSSKCCMMVSRTAFQFLKCRTTVFGSFYVIVLLLAQPL